MSRLKFIHHLINHSTYGSRTSWTAFFTTVISSMSPEKTNMKISINYGGYSLSLRRHAHGPLAKRLETLQECRSRRRIGWIIQDFQETCMSRSLTFRLETKMPWRQTPSGKKKAIVFTNVTTSAYHDQLNAGFSKVCEIFKVRGI